MAEKMINTVYTIGYSGFNMENFLNTLSANKISLVIDVRSLPYSKHFLIYNKDNLSKILNASGIYYRNYALEFGARQKNLSFYPKGYLDFDLFSKSDIFLSGINKLEKSMEQDYRFVLMCSEKDPIICHRAILVARAFFKKGYKIIHLLPNNKTSSQEDIEKKLLDIYLPNRKQLDLFTPHSSIEEDLNKVYKLQNSLIGYKIIKEAVL